MSLLGFNLGGGGLTPAARGRLVIAADVRVGDVIEHGERDRIVTAVRFPVPGRVSILLAGGGRLLPPRSAMIRVVERSKP